MIAGSKSTRAARRIWLRTHRRRGSAARCGFTRRESRCVCLWASVKPSERPWVEGATRLAHKPIKVEAHTASSTSGISPTCWRCQRGARYVRRNRSSEPQPKMPGLPRTVQLRRRVRLLCANRRADRPCAWSLQCRHSMGDNESLMSRTEDDWYCSIVGAFLHPSPLMLCRCVRF